MRFNARLIVKGDFYNKDTKSICKNQRALNDIYIYKRH